VFYSTFRLNSHFQCERTEKRFLRKRSEKVGRQSSLRFRDRFPPQIPKVTIHNHTDIILPEEIKKILEKGLHGPLGGYGNKKLILTKFEETWQKWMIEAKKAKLDIFQINHVKSELFLAFEQLKNCSTKNDTNTLKNI
jgi:hypothetical protein